MSSRTIRRAALAAPVGLSVALLISACGGSSSTNAATAQEAPVPTTDVPVAAAPAAVAPPVAAPALKAPPLAPLKAKPAKAVTKAAPAAKQAAKPAPAAKPATSSADQAAYDAKGGATDVGVTKDAIKLGSINMHGMALANLITEPQVRGDFATANAINDRGGVLGRRLDIVDCDDGPGEVSRSKACIKKLTSQDRIFSLVSGISWATASIHDDLKQYGLPYVGTWAYSQTEWQDPFMFPTHMSMIHEAMAGAHWVANVIHPTTYGLICLTSPEMQLACNQVARILDDTGAKLVKRADVSISETSMSSYVLAMRAAAPEHIVHYVINAATMAKFMVEAAQQGYYPPKGISGNHLASEALGSLFGTFPAGRYWTNTTYKLWGSEFIATMSRYARGNRGANHHVVQAGYTGINIFAKAAEQVGPNLTRPKLMAALGNGVWASDSGMDQKWSYTNAERYGTNWSHDYGQGREFMYEYKTPNTISNPDGTPNGWAPDPNQFVIYTWK